MWKKPGDLCFGIPVKQRPNCVVTQLGGGGPSGCPLANNLLVLALPGDARTWARAQV